MSLHIHKPSLKIKIKNPTVSIFSLYCMLAIVLYVLPAVKVTVPYVFSGLFFLLFLLVSTTKDRLLRNSSIQLILATVLIFLVDFLALGVGPIDAINEAIRNIRFFIPVLWLAYFLRYSKEEEGKKILFFYSAIVIYMLIKTFAALRIDQWIPRIMAGDKSTESSAMRAYRMANVGGFEFSYMMGPIIIVLVWAALNSRNKWMRIVYWASAVISYYYVLRTMYTTLVLLTTIGIVCCFIWRIPSRRKRAVILMLCLAAITLSPLLFEYLASVFPEESLLSVKFGQIHDAMTGGGLDALGSRPAKIMKAIKNWSTAPIFGTGIMGLGTHSTFFGTLERNGLIGVASLVYLFIWAWKLLSQSIRRYDEQINLYVLSIVFLYLILLGILNPIGYIFELPITVFFIIPVWMCRRKR